MPFTPASLANLYAWHDVSQVAGTADGAALGVIPDASGSGRPTSQAGSKPIYHTGGVNYGGQPYLRFSGPSLQFLNTNFGALPAPWTVFLAFYVYPIGTANDNSSQIWTNPGLMTLVDRGGLKATNLSFTTSYSTGTGDIPGDLPVPLFMAFCSDGTNSQTNVCGVDMSVASNGFSPALAANSIYGTGVAATAPSMDFLQGGIYNAVRTLSELQQLQAYILGKYYPATGIVPSFTTPHGANGAANTGFKVSVAPSFTLSGPGTIYGSLTPATATVTPTDGAGGAFSPSTIPLTNVAPSSTGNSYTPATGGSETITANNDASLTPLSCYYGSTGAGTHSVAYNIGGVYPSPYVWRDSGTFFESNNPGAYVRKDFGGTSLAVGLDFSTYTGASQPSGDYPSINWQVDGATWNRQQLASGNTTFSLASGLSANILHRLKLFFSATNAASLFAASLDRWTTPVACLRINGWTLDTGFVPILPTDIKAKKMFIIADSNAEGIGANAAGITTPAAQDATLAWPAVFANLMNCEYGQCALAGTDFNNSGNGNVPVGHLEWPLYSAGHSRLVSSLLSPPPDYVVIGWGTNAAESNTILIYGYAMLAAIFAAAPSTQILVVIPYVLNSTGRPYSQNMLNMLVAQFKDDNPSANVDTYQGATSLQGTTGHYGYQDHNVFGHSLYRAYLAKNAVTPSAGYSRGRLVGAA